MKKKMNKLHSFCAASFPIAVTHDVTLDHSKRLASQRIPEYRQWQSNYHNTLYRFLIMTVKVKM